MFELLAFFTGAIIMTIEIAGARIISPFLGSSFIIWTSTIGIIMFALSIGYYTGGKISDKKQNTCLLSIFYLIAGIYLFFTAVTQFSILENISNLNINLYIKSVLASCYLFVVPSFALGITSPYIIKSALNYRQIKENDTGNTIGKFYAISTIGSILSTFLTGFYIIVFFGLEDISYFLSLIVLLISLISLLYDFTKTRIPLLVFEILILIICFFFTIYNKLHPNYIFPNTKYAITTPYQYIGVVENGPIRYILLSKYWIQSALYKEDNKKFNLVADYTDFMFKLYKNKPVKENVLILGNASGTILSQIIKYNNDNKISPQIDVVEIDKEMTKIAYKYFFMPKDNSVNIQHEDARTFINRVAKNNIKKYDIVLFDIYSTENYIPNHLITLETFKKLKSILSEDGIIAINVISGQENSAEKSYLEHFYTTIKSVSDNIIVYKPEQAEYNIFNTIVTLYNNPKSSQDVIAEFKPFEINVKESKEIFTDNYCPLEKIILGYAG